MATILTPPVIDAQHVLLFDFIQEAFNISRKARLLKTDPSSADAYTLDQPAPGQETNIAAVEEVFERLKDLKVKFDGALSEMTLAIEFLKDDARRETPLPTAITGPRFGVSTSEAP